MATLRATLFALFCPLGLAVALPAALDAAPQEAADVPPVSLERIKERLEQTPGLRLTTDAPLPQPVPTFRARVDQRVFVLTLEEALHRQFDLNILQRQSADWAAKCCGYNIGQLVESVHKARQRRILRKTREQIWRELAEIEAARRKTPAAEVNCGPATLTRSAGTSACD